MSPRDLLDQALRLPPAARGRLVHELIASLEDTEPEDAQAVEQAWAAELEERAVRAVSGESPARSLDDACDELAAKRQKT